MNNNSKREKMDKIITLNSEMRIYFHNLSVAPCPKYVNQLKLIHNQLILLVDEYKKEYNEFVNLDIPNIQNLLLNIESKIKDKQSEYIDNYLRAIHRAKASLNAAYNNIMISDRFLREYRNNECEILRIEKEYEDKFQNTITSFDEVAAEKAELENRKALVLPDIPKLKKEYISQKIDEHNQHVSAVEHKLKLLNEHINKLDTQKLTQHRVEKLKSLVAEVKTEYNNAKNIALEINQNYTAQKINEKLYELSSIMEGIFSKTYHIEEKFKKEQEEAWERAEKRRLALEYKQRQIEEQQRKKAEEERKLQEEQKRKAYALEQKRIQCTPLLEKLKSHGFEGFLHTTEFNNIAGILKSGYLIPRGYLDSNAYIDRADQEVISKTENSIKNCCRFYYYFCTPTNYQAKYIEPVILVFKESLMYYENVFFSEGNAAAKECRITPNPDEALLYNWDAIFERVPHSQSIIAAFYDNGEGGRIVANGKQISYYRNAEFLAKYKVNINFIKKIYCKNETTRNKLLSICGDVLPNVPIEVNVNKFIV